MFLPSRPELPTGQSSSEECGWAFPALGGQAQLKKELVCGQTSGAVAQCFGQKAVMSLPIPFAYLQDLAAS